MFKGVELDPQVYCVMKQGLAGVQSPLQGAEGDGSRPQQRVRLEMQACRCGGDTDSKRVSQRPGG